MRVIITKVVIFKFLNFTNTSPLVKIDAPVPNGGITTINSAPDPVKPDPNIPLIDSMSIEAVV